MILIIQKPLCIGEKWTELSKNYYNVLETKILLFYCQELDTIHNIMAHSSMNHKIGLNTNIAHPIIITATSQNKNFIIAIIISICC